MSTLGTGSLGSGTLGAPANAVGGEPGLPAVFRVELDGRPNPSPFTRPAESEWVRLDGSNPLREFEIDRGAKRAYEPVEPAEGTLVFENLNGFLDPSFPASPYAGLLDGGRQIRFVRMTEAAKQVIFTGIVKNFPISYDIAGLDPTSKVEVTDVDWLLGATELPESIALWELQRGVKYSRPAHIFMFRENEGSEEVSFMDDINDYEATPIGRPKSGGGQLVPHTSVGGFESGKAADLGFVEIPITVWPEPPWSFGIMMRIAPSTTATILADTVPRKLFFGVISSNFHLRGDVLKTDGVAASTTTVTKAPGDDEPHFVMIENTGTVLRVFLDGTNVGSVTYSPASQMPTGAMRIGSAGQASYAFACIWDELMVGSKFGLKSDIMSPLINQDAHARVRSLLNTRYPDLPLTVWRTGTVTDSRVVDRFLCLPARLDSLPLRDVVQRTCAGGAQTWVNLHGELQFAWRHTGQLVANPDGSLGVRHGVDPGKLFGVGGVQTVDYHVADGEDDLVTMCRVKNEAGALQVFENGAASRLHGQRRREITDVLQKSAADLWRTAEREVHYRGQKRAYVDEFVVQPGSGATFDDALLIDVNDRVDHARTRPYDGAVVTDRLRVVGLKHLAREPGFVDWETRVRTEPVQVPRLRMRVGSATDVARGATASEPGPSAPYDVPAGIDVRARVSKIDAAAWASNPAAVIASRRTNIDDAIWQLYIEGSRLKFIWYFPGTTSAQRFLVQGPKNHVRRALNIPVWFRAVVEPTVARVQLMQSMDGEEWTTIHTETMAAQTGMRSGAHPLKVGYSQVSSSPFNGWVNYVDVRDLGGVVRARFDPSAHVPEGSPTGFYSDPTRLSWASDTGETWTAHNAHVEPW